MSIQFVVALRQDRESLISSKKKETKYLDLFAKVFISHFVKPAPKACILTLRSQNSKPVAFSIYNKYHPIAINDTSVCPCIKRKSSWIGFISLDGLNLKNAPSEIRCDFECVEIACRLNGKALEFASVDLKDNLTIVQTAVCQSGLAIQYASKRLQANKAIALVAVMQNKEAYKLLSESLKQDPDIMQALKLA